MQTKLLFGERIARTAQLRLSCTAAIYDQTSEKLLLVRRRDNSAWCLPGGAMDAGESVAECCIREVWEETGLRVKITNLAGIYSNPDFVVEYADGRRVQIVAFLLAAEIVSEGDGLQPESEMSEVGYFTAAEAANLPLLDTHRERIQDAYAYNGSPFLK